MRLTFLFGRRCLYAALMRLPAAGELQRAAPTVAGGGGVQEHPLLVVVHYNSCSGCCNTRCALRVQPCAVNNACMRAFILSRVSMHAMLRDPYPVSEFMNPADLPGLGLPLGPLVT